MGLRTQLTPKWPKPSPRLRRGQFGPFTDGRRSFTPTLRHEGQLQLVMLPLSTHESHVLPAAPIRSGLHSPLPARPICCCAFRRCSASIASPTTRTTMPSADFCCAVREPRGDALANRLSFSSIRMDGGLTPPSDRTCSAHQKVPARLNEPSRHCCSPRVSSPA